MRLTVLSVGFPLAAVSPKTAGGAEQVLATLDKALVHSGHRSLVLAAAGSKCDGLLIEAPVPRGPLDQAAKVNARRTFKRLLERTITKYSVDVVHMHGLDFADYLPDCGIPTVVSLHLPLSWYSESALWPAKQNVALISVSDAQARTAPDGVTIHRTIPNGIGLDVFRQTAKQGSYALAMTRICPEKGLHLAQDAARQAGLDLLIAGNVFDYPEHKNYFETVFKPRLNQHCRFIGAIGGQHKNRLLAGAKCLLIPSLAPETSSLVAMEAMACGTPVIAWRSGALCEIVCHGRTGFLVSSVKEMAEAIARIGSISRAECRREAESRFGSARMIEKYFDLYREMLNAQPAGKLDRELQAA